MLCWQDKLELCDENTIAEFAATAECGKKCKCFDKLRDLGENVAVQVIHEICEARVAGTLMKTYKISTTRFSWCQTISACNFSPPGCENNKAIVLRFARRH